MFKLSYLIKHISRKAHHGKIVNNKKSFDVDWFSISHEFGAKPDDDKVTQEDSTDRQRRINQKPSTCPLVCGNERIASLAR